MGFFLPVVDMLDLPLENNTESCFFFFFDVLILEKVLV